ncbi:GNAT family N-acetyltransferase [Nocardiopsis coralliicola]
MLKGEKIGLRARHEEDIPVLVDELYGSITDTARAEGRPWRPIANPSSDPRLAADGGSADTVKFSIVELAGGTLAGAATLWDIDTYHRSAHIGLGLLPGARGRGYSTDAVAVLCHYAFIVHGLQRVQIETLTDNAPMLRAAERNGFVREGVRRSSAWVMGGFADEAVLGLLAGEWRRARSGAPS